MINSVKKITLIGAVLLLSACAAATTSISKRNLDVETKMSDSVFLTPVASAEKTVYLEIRNGSDKPDFTINDAVRKKIQSNGYTIVDDPDKAHYILQANILYIKQADGKDTNALLTAGYGAAIGAGTASVLSSSSNDVIGGALIGGAISTVADAMVKDVTYVAVTDIQISERSSTVVNTKSQTTMKQGSNTTEHQSTSGQSDWKQYRTRIVTTANKSNLKFADAQAPMETAIGSAVGGLF